MQKENRGAIAPYHPSNTKHRTTAILGATILEFMPVLVSLMTDPASNTNRIATPTESSLVLDAIHNWLDKPARLDVTDELASLSSHLTKLRQYGNGDQHQYDTLAKLYDRAMANVEKLLPSLSASSLPTPRKLRQTIRNLQDLLRALAESLFSAGVFEPASGHDVGGCNSTALWQSMHALSLHLLISNLTAAPASTGIWRLLHSIHDSARRLGITAERPSGAPCAIRELYSATIVLACAQPAAFTARDTSFVANYLSQHASLTRWIDKPEDISSISFWIDPVRDVPATPCSRKAAPDDSGVIYFDCARLSAQARKDLATPRSGIIRDKIGLNVFTGTRAERGALRRLAEFLGNPGKRRFPRRRQHYRIVLCAGLENLWNLFSQKSADAEMETSSWMITNESPDGYSIMHVFGDSSNISVGDVVAVRAEASDKWQICIARWAQSENQEHLEFGLQILATRAIPAMLAATKDKASTQRHTTPRRVLILPRVPPLRSDEMLITPSGLLEEQPAHFVLLIEQGNIEIREARNSRLNEQNSLIEIFSIEPDDTRT